jgi:hypothetical protein
MLSSFGIRAYPIFIESFFSMGISGAQSLSVTTGPGSDTLWAGLGVREGGAAAQCVAMLHRMTFEGTRFLLLSSH